MGMNGTRALTCKHNAQLSCGRVQTPTLAMIAKREAQIREFVPQEYYGISLRDGQVCWTWQDKKSGGYRSFDKERMEKICRELKGKQLTVEDEKVFISGRVSVEEDKPSKLICEKIQNFKEIHKEIWIQFQNMEAYQSMERELYNILRESDGKDRVVIYVREPKAVKRLSENWTVNGDEELIRKLAEKFGMENVKTI